LNDGNKHKLQSATEQLAWARVTLMRVNKLCNNAAAWDYWSPRWWCWRHSPLSWAYTRI